MSKIAKEISLRRTSGEAIYFPGGSPGKVENINTAQLEYTATTLMTYGTIVFAVVLGLCSVTYMTVQQLKK